jgi:hypothetical protein
LIPGNEGHVTAPFLAAIAFVLIDQEILERAKEKRTKSTAAGIGMLQEFSLHDPEEKFLGQVLGIFRRGSLSPEIGKDWTPIDAAELGKSVVGFGFFCRTLVIAKDQTPSRCGKPSGVFVTSAR